MEIKTDKPLASIRLMCYNQEMFIGRAIEGILSQKVNFPVEVVVGDDFSSDATLDIIRSYQGTDLIKFRILDRPIGGEYWINRQKYGRLYNYFDILKACEGRYIFMLDGDDYWIDTLKIQRQVSIMQKDPLISICSHEAYTCKPSFEPGLKAAVGIVANNFRYGRPVDGLRTLLEFSTLRSSLWDKRIAHSGKKHFRDYLFNDILHSGHFMATSSMCIRKDVVDKIGLWYTGTDGGHYFIVLIALSLGRGYHINRFMGVHRLHAGSISQNYNRKKRLALLNKEHRLYRLQMLLENTPEKFHDAIEKQITKENLL